MATYILMRQAKEGGVSMIILQIIAPIKSVRNDIPQQAKQEPKQNKKKGKTETFQELLDRVMKDN